MIDYQWMPGSFVTDELLEECIALYSLHYGRWSANAPRPGEHIRLSLSRGRAWLESPDSNLALARSDGQLVGYAITINTKVERYGLVSWVTQLVVHEDYRRASVAKTLLFSMWGFSNHFAWGLITANPYAVRALEKATRRRCRPERIRRNHQKLLRVGAKHVPYITPETETDINTSATRINTAFLLDHSQLRDMIESASAPEKPWLLGGLKEGWEWFAFTFQDQDQISLTPEEIELMLIAADQITQRAYARMSLSEDHAWAQHTGSETDTIAAELRLTTGCQVLDFGCGDGRHDIALARRGIDVTGVDYVGARVRQAAERAQRLNLDTARFVEGDVRNIDLGKRYDAAICLYDVVGTYADDTENFRILENLRRHLKPGGRCLLSVMNLHATLAIAKYKFNLKETPDALLKLPASHTMERTGDIFDPEYFLVDTASGVVYRKEQFDRGRSLPEELIVRDRRYTKESIIQLCQDAGFRIVWARYVRAGTWHIDRNAESAKEILVLCESAPVK